MDTSPEFFLSDTPEKQYGEPFAVEDLLVFPADAEAEIPMVTTSTVSSSCNEAQEPPGDSYFTEEFCVPYEDLAELEWVSNFVEEDSFSTEELRKLQIIQGIEARTNEPRSPMIPIPVKARSKRSKGDPGNWASRAVAEPGSERRCVHCATEKTPQWRSGPMGPKTLCNACGVRYKSGRLVPEYRPAASPTFVLTKHSNSHRKVVELRRQKEMARAQQQQLMNHHRHQSVMFDEEFMIHQHGFRHVI